jgi:hypothetical protein
MIPLLMQGAGEKWVKFFAAFFATLCRKNGGWKGKDPSIKKGSPDREGQGSPIMSFDYSAG